MLALFASIGLGYAFGRISVAGFSLDMGAVLFAGLVLGAIAPKAAPPALVGSIGLVMFLYGIGIQYGRQFFAGLRGSGLKWNALGAAGVFCALAIAIVSGELFGISPAHSLGMFAGRPDEHANAAGGHRRRRRSRAGHWLLRRLPDRRHRSHSVHLYFLAAGEGSRRAAAGPAGRCRGRAGRWPAGHDGRGGDRRIAARRECRGDSAGTHEQAARSADSSRCRRCVVAVRRARRCRPGAAAARSRRSRPAGERSQRAGYREVLRLASRTDWRPDQPGRVPKRR